MSAGLGKGMGDYITAIWVTIGLKVATTTPVVWQFLQPNDDDFGDLTAEVSQHDVVTIRCWQLTGETALEDMVLGVDERAVRDGINVLSSDDFDACLAIVVCRIGPNFYAHLTGGGALQG